MSSSREQPPPPDPLKPSLLGWLLRQPFAILGAFGLLTFAHDAIRWHEYVLSWIDVWRHVTRPIVSAVFGWLPAWLHLRFPGPAKDYLSMGLIVAGSLFRTTRTMLRESEFARKNKISDNHPTGYLFVAGFIIAIPCILIWPIVTIYIFWLAYSELYIRGKNSDAVRSARLFCESLVWVAVIIVINYALLKGRPK